MLNPTRGQVFRILNAPRNSPFPGLDSQNTQDCFYTATHPRHQSHQGNERDREEGVQKRREEGRVGSAGSEREKGPPAHLRDCSTERGIETISLLASAGSRSCLKHTAPGVQSWEGIQHCTEGVQGHAGQLLHHTYYLKNLET